MSTPIISKKSSRPPDIILYGYGYQKPNTNAAAKIATTLEQTKWTAAGLRADLSLIKELITEIGCKKCFDGRLPQAKPLNDQVHVLGKNLSGTVVATLPVLVLQLKETPAVLLITSK